LPKQIKNKSKCRRCRGF